MASTHADFAAARERAVAACRDDIRAILGEASVEGATLERVKGCLLALAARRDLLSLAQFRC